MLKKILPLLVFCAFLACVYVFLTTPGTPPSYLATSDQLSANKPIEKTHEIFGVIRNINDRNAKIQSVYVPNINIKLKQKTTAKVEGTLYFQKEKRFRLTVRSVLGQEMDIGSNDTHFRFWSKRMNPPHLFYAKHEDLNRAMLKTPLNPAWLLESMVLGNLDSENIEVGKFKENWVILQKRKGASGEEVVVATLINSKTNTIMGNYLYNAQGKMIASSEILDYYQINEAYIPKNIYITWYEEGVIMEWSIGQPQVNIQIPNNTWQIPNIPQKVEMK